jgi:ANTAR domain
VLTGWWRVVALVRLSKHDATHAADTQEIETLRIALDTRSVISQAVGILMERDHISSDGRTRAAWHNHTASFRGQSSGII